ncbi:MAG: hypothetical protein Q8Q44_05770, partial [Nocardioides sp.]|nr:hypothetical protein [Nocardioides sp.]
IMWLWAALIAFGTVLASLYTGPLMWAGLGVMVVLTLVMTFVLPRVHGVDPAPDSDPERTLC